MLVSRGAAAEPPVTAPLLPLLHKLPLATSEGRLLSNATLGVTSLHDELPLMFTGTHLVGQLKDLLPSYSTLPVQGTYGHGLAPAGAAALVSPPPVTVNCYTCDFCDAPVDSPKAHVARSCRVFLLRTHWAFVCLLATTPKQAGAFLIDHTHVVFPAWGTALAISPETDTRVHAPHRPHQTIVYSPFGLAHYEGRPATWDFVRLIPETTVDRMCDLTSLLMVFDTIEFSTRPHPSLNPHVSVSNPRIVLPLSVALLARWVPCHLQAWQMVSGGKLPISMPPPPSSSWTPRVTFLVRPNPVHLELPHLLSALFDPLLSLTATAHVSAWQRMIAQPFNTRAIRDHVLLWNSGAIRTLPL